MSSLSAKVIIMIAVRPLTPIGLFMVSFQFFNMFIASVYYYFFNDVVPEAYVARFMSLFRVMGMAASLLYSMFIYRYAEAHMKEIFPGAGLLYFIAFMLMCLKVREGKYPPPPENIDRWSVLSFFILEASWWVRLTLRREDARKSACATSREDMPTRSV